MKGLRNKLAKTLLSLGVTLCVTSVFAEADVTHEVIHLVDCNTGTNGVTTCHTRDSTRHEVITPSGNTIINFRGVRTTTKALGDAEPFSTSSTVDNYRYLFKAGEEHVFMETYVDDSCSYGSQTITTITFRYVNGQVVKDDASYEDIPC